MKMSWFIRVLATATVVAFAGCGGGGGGGGGGAAFFPVVGGTAPTATPASVTLSGTATYESIPNTTGPLNYSASLNKPVRSAIVEILDGNAAVIASTTTDASGVYSVSVPSNSTVSVRIKAQSQQSGSGATWDLSVRDNTQSDGIYAMESPAFSSGAAAVTRDLRAPSGWDGSSYSSRRVAGPFALLDTVLAAQEKVLSVAPATVFPMLRVFWSVNNIPAGGNRAVGQIGTTSFIDSTSGRSIYVLGKENVDTDEYDVSVIAHEWGHYYQSSFSRDDSQGGSHSPLDLLDRRVAFSEGWGNAWSGIALGRNNYTDSVGASQSQGSNLNLTNGPSSNPGWYREASIQSILWNLNGQVGFKPIHDTMTSAIFKNGVAVTSIHPFTAAFNAVSAGNASALGSLLLAQSISAAANDPFGLSETHDGGVAQALPMYTTATVGASSSACVTNQAGTVNKLGNYVYLKVAGLAARNYSISVTGAAGTDPDFFVYSGRLVAVAQTETTNVQTAAVSLASSDAVLAIRDYNEGAASGSNTTCFTVSIQ